MLDKKRFLQFKNIIKFSNIQGGFLQTHKETIYFVIYLIDKNYSKSANYKINKNSKYINYSYCAFEKMTIP